LSSSTAALRRSLRKRRSNLSLEPTGNHDFIWIYNTATGANMKLDERSIAVSVSKPSRAPKDILD